jgi:hypothetical protein
VTTAASAISRDVPPGALAIERSEQRNVEGWAKRRRGPSVTRISEEGREGRATVDSQKRMMVFSGTSNRGLAEGVAGHLGIELGNVKISKFANGEIYVRFLESVRGADVFLVHSICDAGQRRPHGAAHHGRCGQARRAPVPSQPL